MLEYRKKLRWLVALSTIPLLGVVSAFGLVPTSNLGFVADEISIEKIILPELAPVSSATVAYWHSDRVQSGDTVAEILRRLDVEDAAASTYLRQADEVESFRKLSVGKEVQAETGADGELIALRYLDNNNTQIVVEKNGAGFHAKSLPAQLEQRLFVRSGKINSSLYAATDEVELPDAVANQLAKIFSGDIDFSRDLRKGDTFNVAYEVNYSNGIAISAGRIQAAEFVNNGEAYRAVYFQENPSREGNYYTPEGKSVQKAFLRSPIEFSRVSSGFTNARFHPVLKKWRAHKGTDFAARTGTKVKVTSDGVVSFVGWKNGYGKVVMVKHQRGVSTVYGHLSRFPKGLRSGQRVTQGDIIGYVGMTGLASGPHLHYEFRVNDKQRDPMRVALPDAKEITRSNLVAFKTESDKLLARLNLLSNTRYAKLD
ncbi:MAG: M23 family metallopeptidase [Pseudomonadota bacterium]